MAVTGPKKDIWLVRTLVDVGYAGLGVISKVYLGNAVAEVVLGGW